MTYTNYDEIPDVIYDAIKNMEYSGAGVERFASVTDLCTPPYQMVLKKQHYHDLKVEASEHINILLGHALHYYLQEKSNLPGAQKEVRLNADMYGDIISGAADLYVDKCISDFKVTQTYTYINENSRAEWNFQLNCYAYLFRLHGYAVERLEIIAIFKDWKAKQKNSPGYPPAASMSIPVNLYPDDVIQHEIMRRIQLIKDAMAGTIHSCTDEECWATSTIYAIMKTGRKSAVSARITDQEIAENEKSALNLIKPGHYIETRLGERRRCANFCSYRKLCPAYKTYQQITEIEKEGS